VPVTALSVKRAEDVGAAPRVLATSLQHLVRQRDLAGRVHVLPPESQRLANSEARPQCDNDLRSPAVQSPRDDPSRGCAVISTYSLVGGLDERTPPGYFLLRPAAPSVGKEVSRAYSAKRFPGMLLGARIGVGRLIPN
jgi:hypothetical protein